MSVIASSMIDGLVSTQFVKDYGNYSFDFPLVNPDGSATWQTSILGIVGFIFVTLGISSSAVNSHKPKDEKKKVVTNLYFYLGLLSIAFGVVFLFSSGDNYIKYNQQWYEWYDELPNSGKNSYQQMKMMQGVISGLTSKN